MRKSTIAPLHDENLQPVSREDALAARLRTLRNQPNSDDGGGNIDNGHVFRSGPTQSFDPVRRLSSAQPPCCPPQPLMINRDPNEKVINQAPISPSSRGEKDVFSRQNNKYQICSDEAELDDDQALDVLLESLGEGDFDLTADDHDPDQPPDPQDEAEKLAKLLKKLKSTDPDDDDDNSDGEGMRCAVESILSQARDELSLPPPCAGSEDGTEKNEEETGASTTDDPFSLPSVPSQPPEEVEEPEVDDLTSRLLSLRGIGPVDSFGLPSAPTFRPENRTTPRQSVLQRNSRNKYSDSDQSAWCVVCLEDATVRCEGCDDDVYCSRCWKEMHVGVQAGYEERGHRWVKFEKGGGLPGGGYRS